MVSGVMEVGGERGYQPAAATTATNGQISYFDDL